MVPPVNVSSGRARSAGVAAALSFLWPGLGQWYLGRNRAAIGYAAPVVAVVALVILELSGGITTFAVRLINPSFALTLLVLVLLVGGWRLLAIVDAGATRTGRAEARRGTAFLVAVLLLAVAGTHAVAGYYLYSFYTAGSRIFVGDRPGTDQPPVGQPPEASPSPDDYEVPPFATPEAEVARITILLTGIDKTTQRTHSLTDTLLVVSVEPTTQRISMVSFPRDIAHFPLYDGGLYEGKINSLMSYVAAHPDEFPDGPLPTLAKELGFLLGIPINYFAAVDVDGFVRMIDLIGGVTVDVERAIHDPAYLWIDGGPPGFYLPAGRQKLDARTALAFVRSRMGAGDNDFTRAARQQQLLVALREELTNPMNVGRIPALLDAAAETIRTNLPPERVDELVVLAQEHGGDIRRVVLQPPTYSVHPPTSSTGGIYTLRLKQDAIRQLSVELYGEDSAFWSGTFGPDGSPVPVPPG